MTILEVFIFRGEQLLGSRVYSDAVVTVGRSPGSLLQLDDKQISRLHATLRVEGDRMIVRDEGSSLGTLVNGVKVKEQVFRESDTLTLGVFRLKVTRRSMGQSLDYGEDEVTDAGQHGPRGVRAATSGEPAAATPVATPVAMPTPAAMPVAPTPAAMPVATPAVKSTPAAMPVATPAVKPTPAAMPVAPTPAAAPLSGPRVAQNLADSASSEIRAGLEDSAQVSMADLAPHPGVLVAGPPMVRPVTAADSESSREFAVDPKTTPRAPRSGPSIQPPTPKAPASTPSAPSIASSSPVVTPPAATPPAATPLAVTPPAATPPAATPPTAASVPVDSAATPASHAALDRDDDEEDEDEDFVPSFSLLDRLSEEALPSTSPAPLHLEIIHHRDGRVLDVQQVTPGGVYPQTGARLVRLDPGGRAQLSVNDDLSGHVFLNGKPIPLEEIRRGARDRKGVSVLELREGDRAEIAVSRRAPGGAAPLRDHFHVRFIRAVRPSVQRTPAGAVVRPLVNRYLIGALFAHALALFGLSQLPADAPAAAPEEPRFAEVSLKAIQIETPPEPPKPTPPEPTPPTEMPTATQKVRPVKVASRAARPSARAPQNALAALEMLKPESGPSSLKDVVSNINAVSVPADARARFKVGGAIGKLPVGEVRVSTAGAARDATSSGRELLSKGGIGDLKGAGGSGNVRGVVKQAPAAALQAAGQGRLSRAQIQAVINEHVAQVQACYEKNLMRDHSLAGKITFDWVISPTGGVSSARVRSSTMAGSAVSTCILQEIRSWNFPAPDGGAVSVTYPFIFNAQGF